MKEHDKESEEGSNCAEKTAYISEKIKNTINCSRIFITRRWKFIPERIDDYTILLSDDSIYFLHEKTLRFIIKEISKVVSIIFSVDLSSNDLSHGNMEST